MKLLDDKVVDFLDMMWEQGDIYFLKVEVLSEVKDKVMKVLKPYRREK